MLSSGFELANLIEPKPPVEMRNLEEMKNEMRRPMMLLISARNKNHSHKVTKIRVPI